MYTVQWFCVYNIKGGKGRLAYVHVRSLPCKFIDYNIFYMTVYIFSFTNNYSHVRTCKNHVAHEIQHFNHASTTVLLPKNFAFSWGKPNYPSVLKHLFIFFYAKFISIRSLSWHLSYGSSFEEFQLLLSNKVLISSKYGMKCV